MFLLICTLNILVIKQHLCKPIVKSILIGTKISQVVELQLKRVASKSHYQSGGDEHQMRVGYQIWAEKQSWEQLTAVPIEIRRDTWIRLRRAGVIEIQFMASSSLCLHGHMFSWLNLVGTDPNIAYVFVCRIALGSSVPLRAELWNCGSDPLLTRSKSPKQSL